MEYISLFVKSIFVDNMIFAYFLGPPKKEGVCDNDGENLIIRDDDKEETVKNRLSVYHKETQPLIDYYKKAQILKTVDGTKSADEVFEEIKAVLS